MSIKDLFGSTDKTREYLGSQTEKDAFQEVESSRNMQEIARKQDTYLPDVDYSKPESFAKFGSAYLYYKSAIERIINFYPYDGSDAEINRFYNQSLDIEKYIFNNLYPRTTGYILLSADGYGTVTKVTGSGYSVPATSEYITFFAGPNVTSADLTLKEMIPDFSSSNLQYNNVYDDSIYTTAGLISTYGKGTRESNLKSNFDTGVTIEFWAQTGSVGADPTQTTKQVIFDMWNNANSSSADYGRITVELTGGVGAGNPLLITVQSGSGGALADVSGSTLAVVTSSIGQNLDFGSWKQYAISLYNTGSNFEAKLYVNGELNDVNVYSPGTATATIVISDAGGIVHGDTFTLVDSTGVSTVYTINGGAPLNGGGGSGGSATVGFLGVGGGSAGKIAGANAMVYAINNTTDANYTSVSDGVDTVTITQGTSGVLGNRTNADAISHTTVSNFIGGTGAATIAELQSKNMMGRVGALLAAPSASAVASGMSHAGSDASDWSGAGKFSGSLDEFRFWKVVRDASQIGRHWFTQIRGGVNTDISNTSLGMYYKFNEGITGDSTIDSNVLDYGGRLCNGTWTGYTTNSRNTGSAIVLASAAIKEYLDPIIYESHPDVSLLKTNLLNSGSYHDGQNTGLFANQFPTWMIEEEDAVEDDNLQKLSHIAGAYFDKLHLQISAIPQLKHHAYPSASADPLPFARHLPQSLGLYTPDLFIDATLPEKFLNRSDTALFEGDLHELKNLIYTNLYNNLANIYKAKGTEKAIKNIFRCFYLSDDLVNYNVYSNNQLYELRNNLQQILKKRTFVNFNDQVNIHGVVCQAPDPHTDSSRGYISSSGTGPEPTYGMTAEVGIVFPRFIRSLDSFRRDFTQISLFGMHSASAHEPDNTAIYSSDVANFQVYAVRDAAYSPNVYFKLESGTDPYPLPTLTSSTFLNVYNNENWSFSVRIKPNNYPVSTLVSSSNASSYDVVFGGYNNQLGTVQNSFSVTGTISVASATNFLQASKRLYVGAYNTNITGATNLYPSDVKGSTARYWLKYLDNYALQQHALDPENAGISGSYMHISPLDSGSSVRSYNFNALALDWYFGNVTGSDSAGAFYVSDLSSGSALVRDNFGWMGEVGGHLHTGKAVGFKTSSEEVIKRELVNEFKFISPERVVSSDQVQILSLDDEVFGTAEQIPDYIYTLEKSMYNVVSEQILDFFAGAADFHNLIGEPVNRYRMRYKSIEHLRRIFFEKFQNIQTAERFTEYYKWFDDALALIIKQLVPASSGFVGDVYNTIESHVLERNKYNSQYPTLEFKPPDIETRIMGPWSSLHGYSPVPDWVADLWGGLEESPRDTKEHGEYWKRRAIPAGKGTGSYEIATGDVNVDRARQRIRETGYALPVKSGSALVLKTAAGVTYRPNKKLADQLGGTYSFRVSKILYPIKGGVNFDPSKRIGYAYSALYPAGPVYAPSGGVFVPQNVMVGFTEDLVPLEPLKIRQERKGPSRYKKAKRIMTVNMGRDYARGTGYTEVLKNTAVFPFNLVSSSVKSGYSKQVITRVSANLDIVNLHNDVYGDDMEVPLQGPFTNYAVGGHQSRHIPLNKGSDSYLTRPEAWKLLLGKCPDTSGAIGLASPDYPWPEANEVGKRPYPMTGSQKATYYRDMTAKRPVNIRNIRLRSGSTILGNYRKNYEIVHTVGSYSNPRNFVKSQSSISFPPPAFQNTATSSTQLRTFLDIHRGTGWLRAHDTDAPAYTGYTGSHFEFMGDYSIGYLTKSTGTSVIRSKFSNPGGLDTSPAGYRDFRGNEFAVYNATPWRNLSVIKPSQGPSGTLSEATGAGGPGIRVSDIHGYDYGLRSQLARHTARFGRDSLWVTGTTAVFRANDPRSGAPGAHYNQLPGFHKVHRNNLTRPRICGTDTTVICRSNEYDNFFVQHQIPRSDRQYAWITGAISQSTDYRYYGFMPIEGPLMGRYSSSIGGIGPYFPFLSASDFGSYWAAGNRSWGVDKRYAVIEGVGATYNQPIIETPAGLNTNLYENVTGATNTMGPPGDSIRQIRNTKMISGINAQGYASFFNGLMIHRGSNYGWGTFNQTRQGNHPILRHERKNNKLSMVVTGNVLNSYDLRPLSLKGRAVYVNYDYDTTKIVGGIQQTKTDNVTVRTSYNNELIYFNQPQLNAYLNINPHTDKEVTSFEQLMALRTGPAYNLNWVHYRECVYPALRNEFAAGSAFRSTYDNKYWRNSSANRMDLGNTLSNSLGIWWGSGSTPETHRWRLSQSSWPLDAPTDFLTRTGPPIVRLDGVDNTALQWTLKASSSGGELQNTYGWWHASASTGPGLSPSWKWGKMIAAMAPGALYARKHTLTSPISVMSPNQISTRYNVGSYEPGWEFQSILHGVVASTGSGEAYWDAPAAAGYLTGTIDANNVTTIGFVSAASEPWFNSYDDFKADLKLKAKGYSVIPEFRISEKVEDYLRSSVKRTFDTFDIPGTDFNSSQEDFYLDFSNSDFMKNFLDVRKMSDLSATEFKLTCRAAIRFNPYKGFYPAQRTLDLVSEFSRSYAHAISTGNPNISGEADGIDTSLSGAQSALARAVYQPLFAPGILYNSIKAGVACDWALVTDPSKIGRYAYSASVDAGTGSIPANWALYPRVTDFAMAASYSLPISPSASFFSRIPFEAIVEPSKYMAGLNFIDMEADPYARFAWHEGNSSVPIQASFSPKGSGLYNLMASNFVAEVGNFFLKDSEYTKLVPRGYASEKAKFKEGEIYAARLRMRASHQGQRTYQFESGSDGSNQFYTMYGAKAFCSSSENLMPYSFDGNPRGFSWHLLNASQRNGIPAYVVATGGFEIPQDPQYNPDFKRNFVMYSRASAFGPPFSGRLTPSQSTGAPDNVYAYDYVSGSERGIRDCFNGHNWAYTPPYQHGEAWVDFVFRPSGSTEYDLEQILQETETVRWRFDPGPRIGIESAINKTSFRSLVSSTWATNGSNVNQGVYSGRNTNINSMQLDDSLNLFGVENVYRERVDKFGNKVFNENEVVGKRWVIQPKFETPMLNFADTGVCAVTGNLTYNDQAALAGATGTKTVPWQTSYGRDTAANGMWHQFGILPDTVDKGIFLEIADIPDTWLDNHYLAISESSPYNAGLIATGANGSATGSSVQNLSKKIKSFSSLMGFGPEDSSVRLGKVAPKKVIKEAVVVVPYIIDYIDPKISNKSTLGQYARIEKKKFITIPTNRYEAALKEKQGSAAGDSLDAAGVSIRNLVQKMEQYVLPQQFDFLQNPLVEPIVMYIFEFKYELDQDDLSYIWQNIAPRDYKKMSFQTEAVAHELFNTELLTEQNLMENPDLRWMVFKVKQKSQAEYKDAVVRQASEGGKKLIIPPKTGYPIRYNWPYDYLSIVELVKIDAEVLYKSAPPKDVGQASMIDSSAPLRNNLANNILSRRVRNTSAVLNVNIQNERAKIKTKKVEKVMKQVEIDTEARAIVEAKVKKNTMNIDKTKATSEKRAKMIEQVMKKATAIIKNPGKKK